MARSPGKGEHRGAPRVPGLLSGVSVGLVFVLVAAIALTARQEPPPTVAEFAPQAVEQIKESLPEQAEAPEGDVASAGAANAEEGDEEGPGGAASPPPPDSPEAKASEQAAERKQRKQAGGPEDPKAEGPEIEEPRVRRCVGDPPRQTEDPQSPPCVPYFEGDNGGATYKGVTANEIRVAVPRQAFGGAPDDYVVDLFAHFNRRYEFYGRKLVPVFYDPRDGTFAHPNPANMIADAKDVDLTHKAFATVAYPDRKGAEHHYYDELARRGIISSAYRAQTTATAERYRQFAPYEWNAMPPIEVMLTGLGNMICETLAGDPPQGGGPDGDGKQYRDALRQDPHKGPRIFGLIYAENKDGSAPPVDVLRGRLSSCGAKLAADLRDSTEVPQGTVVAQLKEAGVTSAIYLGDPGSMRNTYMQAATNQQYFPEWILSSYIDMDVDNVFQPGAAPVEQSRNVLGVTYRDRLLPRQRMPWYWAMRESAPAKDPAGGQYYPTMAVYRQLLQLASGIQMAGPKLTPETFEEGLQGADFPNPGAGEAPNYQAPVDYEGRYTPTDTAALYFYDAEAPGTVDPSYPGAVCYVNNGSRRRVDNMPTSKQPFFGSCR